MTKDEREQLLRDAQVFALASPYLIPILEKRKKEAMGRLLRLHREGQMNNHTIVAELSVIEDIEREIRQKELTYNTLKGE